ncbi:MAG: HD domain-containing protein [Clostridiales bacterium]|jgi:3'-5' exoribonuclease|nr:HD domain-containing protein [Clostridiales bacterium]
MKYINEFENGERLIQHFFCLQKNLLKTKSGKDYLSLILRDRTGTINARVWEINNDIEEFSQGDFIKVDANAEVYQDNLQLKVNRIRKSNDYEYDISDFVPCSDKNLDDLKNKLEKFIDSVQNIYLNQLLEKIFEDKNNYKKFCVYPAARNIHHNYVHGLIEHTVSVSEICEFLAKRVENVFKDLLISCAILHDFGKIFELSDFPDNSYTDEGELIGHIILIINLINRKIIEINNFPEELKLNIIHVILSHHGQYDFGSPKLPSTLEAIILSMADNLDAKINQFTSIIKNDNSIGNFTNYNRSLERRIYKDVKKQNQK